MGLNDEVFRRAFLVVPVLKCESCRTGRGETSDEVSEGEEVITMRRKLLEGKLKVLCL